MSQDISSYVSNSFAAMILTLFFKNNPVSALEELMAFKNKPGASETSQKHEYIDHIIINHIITPKQNKANLYTLGGLFIDMY